MPIVRNKLFYVLFRSNAHIWGTFATYTKEAIHTLKNSHFWNVQIAYNKMSVYFFKWLESFHGTRNQTHDSLTCVFLLGHYFPNRKLHVSNSILCPYKLELWMSLTKSTSRSSHLQQYPEPVHPVEYSAELPGPPILSKIIFRTSLLFLPIVCLKST